MIPRAHVTAWRARAPWPTDAQIEQDLILSRAPVEMFSQPTLAQTLAFRGGTALHKLFLQQPGRYSEDIDLVQIDPGAIGPAIDSIRTALDPSPWGQSLISDLSLSYLFRNSLSLLILYSIIPTLLLTDE